MDLHRIWTMEEKFIMVGCISSAKIAYQICLFWAGERPIEILLFALPACLPTRVEHWNKQVTACRHHSKLGNTHLTLVLSFIKGTHYNFSLSVFPPPISLPHTLWASRISMQQLIILPVSQGDIFHFQYEWTLSLYSFLRPIYNTAGSVLS